MFFKSLSSTLVAFFMILVAFTGCTDDSADEEIIEEEKGVIREWDFFAIEVDHIGKAYKFVI